MFCSRVKEFLSQKGVNFIERDVTKDDEALKELKEMGIMTTPVTKINGNIIVGFDQSEMEKLLKG
jgi:glutaredoxin